MSANGFPWFRLYANDLLGDRKMRRIHKLTGLSLAEIRGAWLTLMCLASESPKRGVLLFDGGTPYDYDDLAEECGMDSLKFHSMFMHLTKMNMVDYMEVDGIYYLPNWEKRQPVSDTTGAERVKKHRQTKNNPVTLQKRFRNALDIDIESDTDTEEDIDKDSENIYQKLLTAFINHSQVPAFGSPRPRDNEALLKMVAAECTPDDIKMAVEYATANGLTVVGPASIANGAIIAAGKRKRTGAAVQTVWAEEHR